MTQKPAWMAIALSCGGFVLACPGCGGDAHVELSAADALLAVARQMEMTVEEYHRDMERHDDARTSAVVDAFVQRVRRDAQDDAALDEHAGAFEEALRRLTDDRRTEWTRRQAATDNIGVMRDVAAGLRRMAVESLSLSDEMRRYLATWMTRRDAEDAGR